MLYYMTYKGISLSKDVLMTEPRNVYRTAGLLAQIIQQIRLVVRLLRDPRVPMGIKLIIPAAFVYIISPIDIAPDLFLGLGQLDDLTILILAILLFIDLCPKHIVAEHRGHGNVIEGTYRVVEDDQPSGPGSPGYPDQSSHRSS